MIAKAIGWPGLGELLLSRFNQSLRQDDPGESSIVHSWKPTLVPWLATYSRSAVTTRAAFTVCPATILIFLWLKKTLDDAGITEQRAALCPTASQSFYNTSKFTLRDLKSRGSQRQLFADFEDYLWRAVA